jgi:spermidine synthase
LIRFATVAALSAAVFVAARLVSLIVLQAGKSVPRLALFIVIAALAAAAVAWVAGRLAPGDGPRHVVRRIAIATVGDIAVLVGMMAIAPAIGVRFEVAGMPPDVTPIAILAVVGLAAALATTGVLAAPLGPRLDTAVRTSVREANPTRTAIFSIFLLSGAAGLMYEVVWSRQLVLVFGNTTQAVSAILTGFFGGMAIGSVVGGRVADRVQRPLRLYGLVEVILVVIVLATPLLFRGIHELYRASYAQLENQPTELALLRYGLALLALAPATILMGATLPTLSRHLSRRRSELGSAFGRLYAVNTIGAIVGTALAGLVLIEILGLTGTLIAGALCSATAGVAAIALDRRDRTAGRSSDAALSAMESERLAPELSEPAGRPATETPATAAGSAARLRDPWATRRLPLIVAFVSGLTSLGYQLLWTRLLAMGSGNTTYVFTVILTLFLVGIATGAALVARQLGRHGAWAGKPAFGRLGAVQVLIAGLVLSGLVILSGQLSGLSFIVRVVLVVLPATVAIGLTLPLASSLVGGSDEQIGQDAGLLLGVNTLGSIGGTFVVPFVLIPTIGSPASIVVLALVNLGLGLVLLARGTELSVSFRRTATGLATGLAVLAVIALIVPNTLVSNPGANGLRRESVLLADAEDEIASVQAGGAPDNLRLLVGGIGMTRLTVDAKVMTYLPLITRPDADRLLVICFGMGSSYRSALIAGLDVDGVELVPSVPNMFGFYYPDANQVLANPDGHLIITDGRNYVELSDRTYDMIVVDPPPPIESAGTSVLYSKEFYEASASRLTPGGVMMEWMPYGQSVDEFRSHVRTFADVFPHVLIAFGPTRKGVYMLGSEEPIAVDAANVRSILARPGVMDDLIDTPDNPVDTEEEWATVIEGLTWIEDDQVREFAGGAAPILDDRPVTEYFLLRRLFGQPSPRMNEPHLLEAMPRR